MTIIHHKLLKTTGKYTNLLAENGVSTMRHRYALFPRTHEDRSKVLSLSDIFFQDLDKTAVIAHAQCIEKTMIFRGKKYRQITFCDHQGKEATAIYNFRQSYLIQHVKKDKRYLIIGRTAIKNGQLSFWFPEVIASDESYDQTKIESHQIGRIYPIYPELQGIKPSRFAKKMRQTLDHIGDYVHEHLPDDVLQKFDLIDVVTAMRQMHYPDDRSKFRKAQRRVMFDRLLRMQLYSQLYRQEYQSLAAEQDGDTDTLDVLRVTKRSIGPTQTSLVEAQEHEGPRPSKELPPQPHRSRVTEFLATLPFELTGAQKKVIKEMIIDIHRGVPMMRLLQGDVGSGKTVVATAIAYYLVREAGQQVAFLAPLSILAQQHYQGISKLLLPLGIRVGFLAGSMTAKQKSDSKDAIAQGHVDVVIGTHAIIQDDVRFANLGLAIVDEQHKFGVKQRSFFHREGAPHVIQMSATPIPRSLALTYFGEFDVSVIDEMPAGRKPIQTKIVTPGKMFKLKMRVLDKINQGQKLFMVTPLIEESEHMENLKAVTQAFDETRERLGAGVSVAMIHGRMKPAEKNQIMQDFKTGKYNVLVATTVIEVGVDIREATMMIIHNAERFGLSQLHQLRGRIGRNDMQSYCFLEVKTKSGDSYERLQAMEETTDGFRLAEIDLQYRGAGEILGTRQSGDTDIPLERLMDTGFVTSVREAAEYIITHYSDLDSLPRLKKYIEEYMGSILV